MQFQVPQFIEVEDKIFGPLTLKQFVYIAGSAGLAFILWRSLPTLAALPLVLAVIGLGITLAFIQINKKPFIYIAEAAFSFWMRGKLYLWKANRPKPKKKKEDALPPAGDGEVFVPTLSENKLKNLAWSLDINEKLSK